MEDEKLKYIIDNITDLNKQAMDEAKVRVDSLAKPLGSLGKLENIAIKLSGVLQGT